MISAIDTRWLLSGCRARKDSVGAPKNRTTRQPVPRSGKRLAIRRPRRSFQFDSTRPATYAKAPCWGAGTRSRSAQANASTWCAELDLYMTGYVHAARITRLLSYDARPHCSARQAASTGQSHDGACRPIFSRAEPATPSSASMVRRPSRHRTTMARADRDSRRPHVAC